MDFAAFLEANWKIIWQSPVIVIAVICAIGGYLFGRAQGRQAEHDLEHRIKLKDDTIAHQERAVLNRPRTAPERVPAGPNAVWSPEAEPDDPAERISLGKTITPTFLMNLFKGQTKLSASKQLAAYLGKWMTVEGKVNNVSRAGQSVLVMLGEAPAIEMIMLDFTYDRERLEILQIGDQVTVAGKLTRADQFSIELRDCELLKAG